MATVDIWLLLEKKVLLSTHGETHCQQAHIHILGPIKLMGTKYIVSTVPAPVLVKIMLIVPAAILKSDY
jgi:hypothetical protein